MPSSQSNKINFDNLFRLIQRSAPWLFWFLSLLPLLMMAYLGLFTRYLADDYSTSGILVNLGFWKAQAYWYQNWSGRYAFTLLVSLFELTGVRIVPFLPAIGLTLWVAALWSALDRLFRVLEVCLNQAWIGMLANVIIFGTIKSFQAYAQVIFWQTGILTYQVSLIFIALAVAVFLTRFYLFPYQPLRKWEIALWALAFFVGGGFSETWVIVQISLLGLALIFFLFAKKSPLRTDILLVLFASFLASWASLLVIAKAPGNMHRDSIMAELSFTLLLNSIVSAFRDVPLFLSEWLMGNTVLVALLFLAGFIVGIYGSSPVEKKTAPFKLGLFLLIGAYILMWAGFIPQYAVMNVRPAERAIFPPMFLFVWAFSLFGVFLGSHLALRFNLLASQLSRSFLLVVLGLTLLWSPVRAAYSLSQFTPSLQLYAQRWDARDAVLRRASEQQQTDVVVQSLRRDPALHDIQTTFWIEGDLQDAPDHWINQAAADYYGVSSISLRK